MHPEIYSFGMITIHAYGLLVALGVVSAILLLRSQAGRLGLDADKVVDLAIVTVLAGFFGARLFYVIQFWEHYKDNPITVFMIWQGGLVLYGGLIGGVLGFLVFVRIHKLSLLKTLDIFTVAMALAQGFGRLGCFFNGCCYGKETHALWAVHFPFLESAVHPTQLYESAFCFSLALILFFLWKKNLKSGTVAAVYFILYPVARFLIEFLRGDNASIYFGFTISQIVSLTVLLVCLLSLLMAFRHGK